MILKGMDEFDSCYLNILCVVIGDVVRSGHVSLNRERKKRKKTRKSMEGTFLWETKHGGLFL